jgi:hypothetical protein
MSATTSNSFLSFAIKASPRQHTKLVLKQL